MQVWILTREPPYGESAIIGVYSSIDHALPEWLKETGGVPLPELDHDHGYRYLDMYMALYPWDVIGA